MNEGKFLDLSALAGEGSLLHALLVSTLRRLGGRVEIPIAELRERSEFVYAQDNDTGIVTLVLVRPEEVTVSKV